VRNRRHQHRGHAGLDQHRFLHGAPVGVTELRFLVALADAAVELVEQALKGVEFDGGCLEDGFEVEEGGAVGVRGGGVVGLFGEGAHVAEVVAEEAAGGGGEEEGEGGAIGGVDFGGHRVLVEGGRRL